MFNSQKKEIGAAGSQQLVVETELPSQQSSSLIENLRNLRMEFAELKMLQRQQEREIDALETKLKDSIEPALTRYFNDVEVCHAYKDKNKIAKAACEAAQPTISMDQTKQIADKRKEIKGVIDQVKSYQATLRDKSYWRWFSDYWYGKASSKSHEQSLLIIDTNALKLPKFLLAKLKKDQLQIQTELIKNTVAQKGTFEPAMLDDVLVYCSKLSLILMHFFKMGKTQQEKYNSLVSKQQESENKFRQLQAKIKGSTVAVEKENVCLAIKQLVTENTENKQVIAAKQAEIDRVVDKIHCADFSQDLIDKMNKVKEEIMERFGLLLELDDNHGEEFETRRTVKNELIKLYYSYDDLFCHSMTKLKQAQSVVSDEVLQRMNSSYTDFKATFQEGFRELAHKEINEANTYFCQEQFKLFAYDVLQRFKQRSQLYLQNRLLVKRFVLMDSINLFFTKTNQAIERKNFIDQLEKAIENFQQDPSKMDILLDLIATARHKFISRAKRDEKGYTDSFQYLIDQVASDIEQANKILISADATAEEQELPENVPVPQVNFPNLI